jgi:hypothetical protein
MRRIIQKRGRKWRGGGGGREIRGDTSFVLSSNIKAPVWENREQSGKEIINGGWG